ncbi:E3 ubiquitin-protein ligase UPL5-like [Lotus japonicus]|uniref:E3 ubiquitin-protein ligase UPL5-like n=1 Tax=Lotus japonicus TaxID=34305 RepID=UPI00258C7B78|nr:E3 ubiquitin-protein ligase UPL5-like [Lotus japonicus]
MANSTTITNAEATSSPAASPPLRFFVRSMPISNSFVLHGSEEDSVKSVHERIESRTGIPIREQVLIHQGKQLRWEQNLGECGIQNDANLQLVGRLRSGGCSEEVYAVVGQMVSLIRRVCGGELDLSVTPIIEHVMSIQFMAKLNAFDVLVACKAPEALIKLRLSSFSGNQDIAGSAIALFLESCRYMISKGLHACCLGAVVEFCKLFTVLVGGNEPLFMSCLSCLRGTLEGNGDRDPNRRVVLKGVFDYVCELVGVLLREMDLSTNRPVPFLLTRFQELVDFIIPLRNGIRGLQAWEAVIDGEVPSLAKEVNHIRFMYMQLLSKMDGSLQAMEDCLANKEEGNRGVAVAGMGWSLHISLLKRLYTISKAKLYDGAEEMFWGVLIRRRNMVSQLFLWFVKRTDDHRWILEQKSATNFECRRHLAMMLFPHVRHVYGMGHEMLIDRSRLLTDSFEYISHASPESLRAGLLMKFQKENATGPGVVREWFLLVCREIFNPLNGLFVACPNDRKRFLPNPASSVHPLHLEYFNFSGRIIGLALMNDVQVGIAFDRVFFKQLAGEHITFKDIQKTDPYLHRSCKKILEMDADFVDSDALGLTFLREVEELGHRKVIELFPGGERHVVNSKNRETFVKLLIHNQFVTSISEQISHFNKGFADILSNSKPQEFFQSLELEDLDRMLHGSENVISVEDWKAHTKYRGYKETDDQISWFWEVVGRMSAEQMKTLLFFWTSVKYLPFEGFAGLKSCLFICRSEEPDDHLPSSHTCFYQLCFPPYSSMAVMQDRFKVITQEHISCSFGAL